MVYPVLLRPEILLHSLEQEFHSEHNEQISRQIQYLESQIEASRIEDEKLYRAYVAGVFNEVEYAGRRKLIKNNEQRLAAELRQMSEGMLSQERLEEQKRQILMICRNATANGLAENAPVEIKRNILKSIIDKIVLNVDEGWFELEGVIHGRYPLFNDTNERRTPGRKRMHR